MINLSERILLLAIDEGRGKIVSSVDDSLFYALAGGIFTELLLEGFITIDKDTRINLVGNPVVDEEIINEALKMIHDSKKSHKITYWINTLATKNTFDGILKRLTTQEIIREKGKRYVWMTPSPVFPNPKGSAKYWTKFQLREMVLAGGAIDLAALALLTLIKHTKIGNLVFTRDEYLMAITQIDVLVKSGIFTPVMISAIEKVEMALLELWI